jgi:hypothetical protein
MADDSRYDRSTSGVRNAEMKWTNHDNLDVYSVRLEGWPTEIPMQNPSTLSINQNRVLRDALICGTLKFCPINPETSTPDGGNTSYEPVGSPSDLSWAISEEFNIPVRRFPLRFSHTLVSNMIFEPQVSHVTDTGRVTYQGESGDYFPGVEDAGSSKTISRVKEGRYPASRGVEEGPVLTTSGGDTALLDARQPTSKRQRLDGG